MPTVTTVELVLFSQMSLLHTVRSGAIVGSVRPSKTDTRDLQRSTFSVKKASVTVIHTEKHLNQQEALAAINYREIPDCGSLWFKRITV